MVTVDMVRDALKKLNGSADTIASNLKKLEIKGVRDHKKACPLYNYLCTIYPKLKDFDLKVRPTNISWDNYDMYGPTSIDNPSEIYEFIMKFDHGEYPDLEYPDLVEES